VPSYIRSNSTRFYAAVEPSYGVAAPITDTNRFPAIAVRSRQIIETARRLDKTGTRTLNTTLSPGRRRTAFEVRTYLSSLSQAGQVPYGVLFQAGLGAEPEIGSDLIVDSILGEQTFNTRTSHGRTIGSAVSDGREIRFITSVTTSQQFTINVPFTQTPVSGTLLFPTITYRLASDLPSLSLYEYWGAGTALNRIVTGAAVDVVEIAINGDRHEFTFNGPAADLIDSKTFTAGTAGIETFPSEPTVPQPGFGFVPGHIGQAWLGGTATQFFSVTEATIRLKNNIEQRDNEFGCAFPQAAIAGPRQITTTFNLFAQDDNQTQSLYMAAKNYQSISMMLQMGKQRSQLMGAFLPNVIPVIPTFDDSETRLQWHFQNNLAQGTFDDELYIAFA
jgi:hypothetical protein